MIKDVKKAKRNDISWIRKDLSEKFQGRERHGDPNADKTCPRCTDSSLSFHWINLKSGVWMCPSKTCTYPLDCPSLSSYIEDGSNNPQMHTKKRQRAFSSLFSGQKNENAPDHQKADHTSGCSKIDERVNDTSTKSWSNNSIEETTEIAPLWPIYPLWKNENSLCWLHVTLTLVLTNLTIIGMVKKGKNKKSMLWNIVDLYCRVQQTFQKTRDYENIKVKASLQRIRKVALDFLKYKQFTDGRSSDSPIFALPLFFRDDRNIKQNLSTCCSVSHTCSCGESKVSSIERLIIPIPSCGKGFQFPFNMVYATLCSVCRRESQTEIMMTRLSPVIMLHFSDGISLEFLKGSLPVCRKNSGGYVLTQVVQYTGTHFICWSRNLREDKWLRADDLGHPVVSYDFQLLSCEPQEIFLMIWEKLPLLKKKTFGRPVSLTNELGEKICTSKISGTTYNKHENGQLSPKTEHKSDILDHRIKLEKAVRYQPYIPKRGSISRQNESPGKRARTFSTSDRGESTHILTKTMETIENYSEIQDELAFPAKSGFTVLDNMNDTDSQCRSGKCYAIANDEELCEGRTCSHSSMSVDNQSENSSECSFGSSTVRKIVDGLIDLEYDSANSSPRSVVEVNNIPQDIFEFLGIEDSATKPLTMSTFSEHTSETNVNDDNLGFLESLDILDDFSVDKSDIKATESHLEQFVNGASFDLDDFL